MPQLLQLLPHLALPWQPQSASRVPWLLLLMLLLMLLLLLLLLGSGGGCDYDLGLLQVVGPRVFEAATIVVCHV